jgi:hypothetical protein
MLGVTYAGQIQDQVQTKENNKTPLEKFKVVATSKDAMTVYKTIGLAAVGAVTWVVVNKVLTKDKVK